MRPELFHRWYDPLSEEVIDFLKLNNISHLVEFIDIDDEDEMAADRLKLICGHSEVPCLIVDMKPIHGTENIIGWLREHLLGQAQVAAS